MLLAVAHGYSGNKQESIKYFSESLKLNPSNLRSLYELAVLRLKNGENAESCKIFNRLEKIKPEFSRLDDRNKACGPN